jgi:ABC-2 type transport system ATP-binding protein
MTPVLHAEGLRKTYQSFVALEGLDLSIPEGSIYGLLGPNGAGKTTFLRMVNQIIAPDSGHLRFQGQDMTPAHARQIGYLPEERGLYKKMKVGEQALYLAQLKGMDPKVAKTKLKEWFVRWELQSWWDKKVEELSKGQAQKIQFITTVLHEPKVLIFDEPFSGFDPVNATLIRDEMLRLHREGATILLSTHRMESVEELCSHIALLNHGKKVLDGRVQDIREAHRSNTYRLVFRGETSAFQVPEGVQVSAISTDARSGHQTINLQTPEPMAGLLMQHLAPQCDPISFEEVLPSMNDIFIQSVQA